MTRRRSAAGPAPGSRRDRGVAALELVGLLPVLVLVGSLTFQAGVAMWAASSTAEAARTAARAASLERSPAEVRAAAEGSLPGELTVDLLQQFGPGHGVALTVKVPRVSPLPQFDVTRRAVMP